MKLLSILTAILGIVVAAFGFGALCSILNGYVLSILWAWFIVPTFHAPVLSIPVAIGVSMVIHYLTFTDTTDLAKKEDSKWWSSLLIALLRPVVVLAFGAVVHCFV